MEVDHHEGLYPCPLHVEWAEEEEEGGVGLAVSGVAEVEEVEGKEGEVGTLSVTLQKYVIISDLLLFHFPKNISIWHQSFFHHLL